ncbi:MAG TPA: hypothetical protein VKB54_17040 [Solirubrobacteraceae bacterium]|nr:hypothetical protein [Solirubrobacteraceae bacterium]
MFTATCPVRLAHLRRAAVVFAALCTALALAISALTHHGADPHPASSPPLADGGYAGMSDRLARLLDHLWDERLGRYRPGADLTETMVNANLLLVHAVAARHGAGGPARNDARARRIADWLVDSPVWTEHVPSGHKQGHAPGWIAETGGWQQHLVIDAEVVDGLTHAYRARHELGLPERTVQLIADRIHRVAAGPYWRWPTLRLNQFNWHVLVFAGDASVSGNTAGFARDAGAHIDRFLRGVGRHGRSAGNLGPGLRFHYLPAEPVANRMNVDSAEYANIVLSFSRFYEQARAAGMPRPSRLRLLREWVRRALAGYWTHSGYANWDSGFGFERWHQTKKLALMQQALIGVASAEELQPSSAWGAWAKWMLDRSLSWYDALAARAGRIPDPVAFGVHVAAQSSADAALGAARMAANAARALDAGLDRTPSARPPALYAYDPDTGRLAVTTPAYSTAIVAVNQGAFPYGGIDLARLMDADGRVAGTIGGVPPAAFGIVLRDAHGRIAAASQRGRTRLAQRTPPLRLVRAPQGVGVPAHAAPTRAYAGPFTDLVATGSVHAAGRTVTSRYRFTATAIEARWAVAGPASRADALFPSWGPGAHVTAHLRGGAKQRLGRAPIALSRIAYLEVQSAGSGYRVTPLTRARGAAVRLVATKPQPSAPAPGPTAAVSLGHSASFAARIAP